MIQTQIECGESADESGGKPIYKSGNEINV